MGSVAEADSGQGSVDFRGQEVSHLSSESTMEVTALGHKSGKKLKMAGSCQQ